MPFAAASIFPFIFGSLITRNNFNLTKFSLGLVAALFTHLSANLINDYADSKSRADWQDKNFYGFFGGSKLIQEGIFTERFYFNLALSFAIIAASAVIALAVILKSIFVIGIYLCIIFFSWSYSVSPLKFSYRRLGEVVIFILFGPALVMGGYFLQTNIFPDLKSFMLSLPFGFITTAILYANEVPDLVDDKKIYKFTWAGIFGQKYEYLFYYLLMSFAFLSIIINVVCKYIGISALFSLFAVFIAVKAAGILKKYPFDKIKLMDSSRLTIMVHMLVSIILIIGAVL